MNKPSSPPTPPPSPESLPSSSDDSRENLRENSSDFSAMSPSSMSPRAGVTLPYPSPLSLMSSPSSLASGSVEPTSSTGCFSIPSLMPHGSSGPLGEGAPIDETSSASSSGFTATFPSSLDQFPSSSRSKLESVDDLRTSSPNHFSSEVSSSSMDVDMPAFVSNTHSSSSLDDDAVYCWVADSSEGAAGTSFFNSTSRDVPVSAASETLVSRSTWQVSCSKNNARLEGSSSQWSSEMYAIGAESSDVSSTVPLDLEKQADRNGSCSGWSVEGTCSQAGEPMASTSFWQRDPVNSSGDVESSPGSWCQESSSEGAVGISWQCDSPNSGGMGPGISSSASSTTPGVSLSLSPWPPPLSSNSFPGATAGISSSTQQYPSNININSTSTSHGDAAPQPMSWRTRASSSPIRLTRVAPTTPPPRPPTPPCSATPSRARGLHCQYPPSPRRSTSPQDLQSPSTVRRSISPPLRQHSRSTPPTPSRRSVSPPLRGRGLAQRMASPRRSVSPVPLQQPLAHPPSPSGRHRLSPRPRSARTPSPRPPRPPNSTPEPSPSPSQQHSPRPHHAKMRGR